MFNSVTEQPEVALNRSAPTSLTARNTSSKSYRTWVSEHSNYIHAYDASTSMRSAISDLLFGKIYMEAAKSWKPKLNENGKWEWSYKIPTFFSVVDIRLTASQKPGGTVIWKLFERTESQFLGSKESAYHLYLSGTVDPGRNSGEWVYYSPFAYLFSPEGAQKNKKGKVFWKVMGKHKMNFDLKVLSDPISNFLFPDSLKSSIPDSLKLVFGQDSLGIFNHLFVPRTGDHLTYNVNGTVVLAKYHSVAKQNTITIQWNKKTHSGFLVAPTYHNGEKACWSSKLRNIPCS